MDVFQLRETVVNEYKGYVESFVNVLDPRIDEFVNDRLSSGELWPDVYLQLNPAFESASTLGDLATSGVIDAVTAKFFGENIRLYQHQEEALTIAQNGDPFVVTTGTGSGKSLTYLIPIYDSVVKSDPSDHSVRSIIVYPMNALINSQLEALEDYARRSGQTGVRFQKYTGDVRGEAREQILQDPPHILLTNYVMLEYMLLRPAERTLLAKATEALKHLVIDELHFYRGRQGADVSMLLRRVQQKAGRSLQVIGTSATVASGNSRQEIRKKVGDVSSKLFGVTVQPEHVVDETLKRVIRAPNPEGPALIQAVEMAPPETVLDSVLDHPLCAWIENAFGIRESEGRLIRQSPETVAKAVERLSSETELDKGLCEERLKAALEAGNQVSQVNSGEPVFAFRLHQFLSSGGSVFGTIEPHDSRELTLDAKYRLDSERVLFPIAFCRECGQDYYLVSVISEDGKDRLVPRPPIGGGFEDELSEAGGFFAIDDGDLWTDDHDELPDSWFDFLKSGPRVKKDWAEFVPTECYVTPNGDLGSGVEGWLTKRPFVFCLRCRAVHTKRGRDYGKLASLGDVGRSSAATVTVSSMISGMSHQDVPDKEAKTLSFTDNRQDASLQSGHLNDFVQVAQLRTAVVAAANSGAKLTYANLSQSIFDAMELSAEDFAVDLTVNEGPGYENAKNAMLGVIGYMAVEDLSRGWRVTQPNLEQLGLVRIGYDGLDELANNQALWADIPGLKDIGPDKRAPILRAFLDHFRVNLAIEADVLTDNRSRTIVNQANSWLRRPWSFDDNERLRTQTMAMLPGEQPNNLERRMGTISTGQRSSIRRYLSSSQTWGAERNLSGEVTDQVVHGIVQALKGHILRMVTGNGNEERGFRIIGDALVWTPGDGKPVPPDPVRTKDLHLRRDVGEKKANSYFSDLYSKDASRFKRILGGEHTGQVKSETRNLREAQFREGKLSALFCSPTMELGVDIKELHAVHLRNMPPNPANYAQRSGRAGRGGRPAFIAAFSAQGNAHDQYFFKHREQMIAGSVEPARMDLSNKELLEAHIHSAWLSVLGLGFGISVTEILDLEDQGFPLLADIRGQIEFGESAPKLQEALTAAREIILRAPEVEQSWWFGSEWLEETVRQSPKVLDAAFDRWRELYRAACQMRDEARRIQDSHSARRETRNEAEQRVREAQRDIDLLFNRGSGYDQSDFYPYRYLASEGFIPGYNFPRLPVRALVRVGNDSESIERYRFLGLSEFGPGNLIYHEGRKHRIDGIVIPSSGIEDRLRSAKLCNLCGYLHLENAATVDLCEFCGTQLLADTSEFPQKLLDQPATRTRMVERISSEEEERVRNGYTITTHFRKDPGARDRNAVVATENGDPLLHIRYIPSASIYRINHGWRRGDRNGFVVDPNTGRWQRRTDDAGPEDADPAINLPITGIKPYVTDNRNVLLVDLPGQDLEEGFLTTLLYALQRGIQVAYQVEEQEISAELIGQGEHRKLFLWESAEGGTGVWERLIETPNSLREVAREALRICHIDPSTGENSEDHAAETCSTSCYECLLSYSNQPNHRHIDRHLIIDFLMDLASSSLQPQQLGLTRGAHYRWLKGLCDPESTLENEFLDHLYHQGFKLPTTAQNWPHPDVRVQPDFYYDRGNIPGACVFVDGPNHLQPNQRAHDLEVRGQLQDLGFRVISIRFDTNFTDQIQEHVDIFGVERSESPDTPLPPTNHTENEIGNFILDEELGSGGFGTVYRAHHKNISGLEVAVKVCNEEFAGDEDRVKKFQEEARFMAQVNHKNVIKVMDFFKVGVGDKVAIVMEYCPGGNLDQLITAQGPMPWEKAVAMAREICEGLNAAHEASVIHRDIKTRNILIGPNNECKITDFGLAASDRAVHMSVVGTLMYMAPEQKSGLPTDKRADIFSLGAVLYRMVTGLDPLFVLNNQPPDDPKEVVPNLPDFLVNTIYRCLEQDRNRRFQNCEELIEALDGVDPGAPASGSTDSGLGITELIGGVESISDEFGTGFWAPIIDDELLESRWMNLANGLKERGISAPDDVHFDLMIEDRVGDVQAIMVWSSPHGSLFLIEEGVEIVGEPGGHIVHASPESDPSEVSQKIQQWLENGRI